MTIGKLDDDVTGFDVIAWKEITLPEEEQVYV